MRKLVSGMKPTSCLSRCHSHRTHTTPAVMEQEVDPKLNDDDAPAPRRRTSHPLFRNRLDSRMMKFQCRVYSLLYPHRCIGGLALGGRDVHPLRSTVSLPSVAAARTPTSRSSEEQLRRSTLIDWFFHRSSLERLVGVRAAATEGRLTVDLRGCTSLPPSARPPMHR